jgi:uncharacterized protein YoaH (UPF0181 family)
MAGAYDRDNAPTPAAAPKNDPFYFSTGKTKTVVIDGKQVTAIDVGSTKPPAAKGVGSISPATGQVITGSDRNKAKELEAQSIGYTKEYIAARGGINAQGYWNDVPLSGQLTAEEQKQVRLPNGSTNTAEMARILQEKQIKEKIASGMSEAEAIKFVSQQYGTYGITSLTGGATNTAGGGFDANGNQVPNGQYDSNGNFVGTSGTNLSDNLNASFSIVEGILKNYDMKGVADSIAKIRKDYPEIASDDILSLLKFDTRYNAPYLERFAGNKILMDKGLPTLDDALYLKAENEYQKIFKAYGVDSLASRGTYATLIGNRMDAADVTDRIKIGYERLKADKYVEEAFRQFYPSISQGDIVAAMLNPNEMKDALERKATAAEIAGSAAAQGLSTGQARAEELVAFGIDKTKAQAGYRYAAQALPKGTMLSQISQEEGITYNQQLVEDIKFKQNVKAQEEEQRLITKEQNRFKAQSGLASSKSLASQARGAGLI